jgi:TRAP-type C4-dicarboxylate transport system substrate-binding protein
MAYRFISALAVAALALATPALAQDKITLRFADSLPQAHLFTTELAKPFMEEVTRATNGRVVFEHYPAEQLGKAKDMLSLARTGVADIAFVVPIYITDKLPLSGVIDLPGGFATSCEGVKGFWKLATGNGILATKDFAPNGVRVLMTVIQPPFQIFTTSRKIETLRDLEGLKLRTAGGAQELTANKLKIVSVKITAPETNEAMGRGTIDGGVLAHVSIGAYGLTSMIKYATNGENFGSAALTWAISETKWKSLPPDVQKIMTEAGERITMQACRKIDKGVDEQLTAWKASGISIVEFGQADHEALRKVFEEVGEDWAKRLDQRGKPGTDTLKAFRDALTQSKAGQ